MKTPREERPRISGFSVVALGRFSIVAHERTIQHVHVETSQNIYLKILMVV